MIEQGICTYQDFAAALDTIGFLPLSTNILGFPSVSAMTEKSVAHRQLS